MTMRSNEELERLRDECKDIFELADRLRSLPEIEVRFDGGADTDSVFKVYLKREYLRGELRENCPKNKAQWFLEIHKRLDAGSFVSWHCQGDHLEDCRSSFADVVKDKGNHSGSQVRDGTKSAWIENLTKRYVSRVKSKESIRR